MLNKEICQRCSRDNWHKQVWNFNGTEQRQSQEELWEIHKVIVCRFTNWRAFRITENPPKCPYYLEHEISQNDK